MPYDLRLPRPVPQGTLRDGVIDYMSRVTAKTGTSDDDLRNELRMLVNAAHDGAAELWDQYRGGRPDHIGRVYAKYGY